ncbi:MAG: hypothetical protein BWK79_02185 [Beggiatoa sp. IS2]|nr:MAG: hypothetical protein BWK79_02185 [Beggiatoa sp. IS2]
MVLACLAGLTAPAYTLAEDRALLIGIDKYQVAPPLVGSKDDVEHMRQFIEETWHYQPTQIHTLTDGQATYKGILAEFDNWLIAGSKPGDRVLFYYSGHGSYVPDNNNDEKDGKDETLVAVEAEGDGTGQIRDDEISARFQKLAGRKVMFIADSCHSGTVTRSAFPKPNPRIKRVFFNGKPVSKPVSRAFGAPEPSDDLTEQPGKVIAYSAVSPSQVALVDSENLGGVFTNRFIKAIRDKAADSDGDGKVTHAEVLDYTRRESQAYCDSHRGECELGKLTPQIDIPSKLLATDVSGGQVAPPPPPTPAGTIEVAEILDSDNTAQLQTQILPSTNFRLKEKMQFKITSQHKGYLFALDIDSAGQLTVIFPNEFSEKRNLKGIIETGQTLTIPDAGYGFDFVAKEPTGKGILLTLLVEEDEAFAQNFRQQLPVSAQRGFGIQGKTQEVQGTLEELYQKLRQTVTDSDGVGRPVKWSMVKTEYTIN